MRMSKLSIRSSFALVYKFVIFRILTFSNITVFIRIRSRIGCIAFGNMTYPCKGNTEQSHSIGELPWETYGAVMYLFTKIVDIG